MANDRADRSSAGRGQRADKPSCETCYFGRRLLCALDLDAPCTTFRLDSPAGLMPPAQPSLLMNAAADPIVPSSPAPAPRAPVFVEHTPVQLDLRSLVPA